MTIPSPSYASPHLALNEGSSHRYCFARPEFSHRFTEAIVHTKDSLSGQPRMEGLLAEGDLMWRSGATSLMDY
jgi:hypothetical protein